MEMVRGTIYARSFNPLDPIGSILDNALNDVEKSLEEVTEKVHDATVDVILQAAEQAARTITCLKAAYDDSLKQTYQAADKLIRENIDRVNDLVTDIINQNEQALLKVADKIGDIIKYSPLSNWWLPLLSDIKPQFFAVEIDPENKNPAITTVLITFSGNFAYADRPNCTPSFTLNNTKYAPTSNTTKELKFLINVSSDDPKINMHKYSFLKGSLEVTWKSGYIPYYSWTTSTYQTLLGLLPASPGRITVVYTKVASVFTQTFKSAPIDVSRNKSHWQTQLTTCKPDNGFNVMRGTASVHWIQKVGDQINATIKSDDHDEVVCEYSNKDASGKFQVYFDESQPVPAAERREEKENLRWGEDFIVTPEVSEKFKMILFEAFNGDKFEFQPRTDNTNPFITLREFDGTIQIKARRASEINTQDVSALRKREIKVLS